MLFIIILYSIVYLWFTAAEKNELRERARHESELVETFLEDGYEPEQNKWKRSPEFEITDSNQLFYYVINTQGELVLQNEQLPFLQTAFINFIEEWRPTKEEIHNEDFTIDRKLILENKEENRFSTYVPKEQQINILMIAKPIYDRDELVGYLYLGQNITELDRLLNRLMIILLISALIFSGISFYLSRVMSKRAMVPIVQAFKRQQEFVADASHELRTPLSVMLSSLDILEMEEENQKGISARMVTNLKEEVKRMTGLVGDLLTLARADSDEPNTSFERFDLRPVAEQTIHLFHAHAHKKMIELTLMSPASITIYGNKERLTQLLYILIDNAIKYSQDSGIVTISLSIEKNMTYISVQDTGIGIDVKDLPHLFERFYRVDKARTRQQGGHGLGLSIAKWIVDIHNGQITVTSHLGEGSTFLVKIPNKSV
jgi:signal transduction histidine kinase